MKFNGVDNAYRRVSINEAVAPNLILRQNADDFFDEMERDNISAVIIDFAGVTSISRSFAHQYLLRKGISPKAVKEINVPQNIERMFNLVKRASSLPPSRRRVSPPDKTTILTV
ncbi:MAG: hypothetical protein JRN53_02980 [Nitrososphaerota archaeon]|nr:hypothetical protein [Nitrososphaerota archaeon]MDG7042453.1 hypothetical protein [Nitrososphaerota archaeon]MDG7043562.1 hypothetical protein [Nitrososphaerota archaeon]MDG7046536.1 hypothetical protein [Nitrososphaerota archaeon]